MIKKLPQNKGLRRRELYAIELTSNERFITSIRFTNGSGKQLTYHLYTSDNHELVRGIVNIEEILHRDLNIEIRSSQYINAVLKDFETGQIIETKRFIL